MVVNSLLATIAAVGFFQPLPCALADVRPPLRNAALPTPATRCCGGARVVMRGAWKAEGAHLMACGLRSRCLCRRAGMDWSGTTHARMLPACAAHHRITGGCLMALRTACARPAAPARANDRQSMANAKGKAHFETRSVQREAVPPCPHPLSDTHACPERHLLRSLSRSLSLSLSLSLPLLRSRAHAFFPTPFCRATPSTRSAANFCAPLGLAAQLMCPPVSPLCAGSRPPTRRCGRCPSFCTPSLPLCALQV